jgi:hypothetical protein
MPQLLPRRVFVRLARVRDAEQLARHGAITAPQIRVESRGLLRGALSNLQPTQRFQTLIAPQGRALERHALLPHLTS